MLTGYGLTPMFKFQLEIADRYFVTKLLDEKSAGLGMTLDKYFFKFCWLSMQMRKQQGCH